MLYIYILYIYNIYRICIGNIQVSYKRCGHDWIDRTANSVDPSRIASRRVVDEHGSIIYRIPRVLTPKVTDSKHIVL